MTNNELHKNISRFYDFFSTAIKKIENDLSAYETYDVKLPCFLKYCKLDPNAPPMVLTNPKSKDYYTGEFKKKAILLNKVQEAKGDEGFKILLNESISFRQITIDIYIEMINRIKELNNAIDVELNNLRK